MKHLLLCCDFNMQKDILVYKKNYWNDIVLSIIWVYMYDKQMYITVKFSKTKRL